MKKFYLLCCITIFFLTVLSIAEGKGYAAENRTALVIGNGAYSSSPLKNPINDAEDMAANLLRMGFAVTLMQNASHQEMLDAISEFGEKLKKGGVGLFFYAGHGVQVGGRNYLLPVGTKINKEMDFKFQAVDMELALGEMGNAGNSLNIMILDACRDNPYGRSFRSATRGLAIISDAPKGTFITYSTSPGKVAIDGTGRNSPYTESLIRHMNTPGLPIEEVFKNVRRDMTKKTKGQQVPWELSSLEGQFIFRPNRPSSTVTVSSPVDSSLKTLEIEMEKDRLRKDQELQAQQKELEELKRRLNEIEQERGKIPQKRVLTDSERRLEEVEKKVPGGFVTIYDNEGPGRGIGR